MPRGPAQGLDPRRRHAKDVRVQEYYGAQRLLMSGGADISLQQRIEEAADVTPTQRVRMPLPMKCNEALGPTEVGSLGALAVVPRSRLRAEALEDAKVGRFT